MSEQRVTFKSDGLTLAGMVRVPDGVSASERRPAFMVLHGFGSNMNAGNVLKPCAMLNELGYVTMRFDMPGCGESEGEKGRLICLEQVGAVSQALEPAGAAPARRAFLHRGSGLELRGRGRGLCGRGRSTHRGGDLGFGLGPRRAEIPRPASRPRGLRQVHRHAGGRPAPPRAHRHLPDGAALRHRADPGAYAWPRGAGLDPDVPGRDRAEHVRFPRRGGGGQDRAAPALALAQRGRLGHSGRAIDRAVPACRPADRAASVRRYRSFHVRRKQHQGAPDRAGLARRLFPGRRRRDG